HTMETAHHTSGKGSELRFLAPLFKKQSEVSALPEEGKLLVEYIQTKYGYHLFVYPFEVKFVHEGMSAVIAYRLSKIRQATFSIATNEYGFELLSDAAIPVEEGMKRGRFDTANLLADIPLGINTTEMARRSFRDSA